MKIFKLLIVEKTKSNFLEYEIRNQYLSISTQFQTIAFRC